MKFEEFSERLQELKAEFSTLHGREPKTLEEFEAYLLGKKLGRVRTGTLRSLKGFDL